MEKLIVANWKSHLSPDKVGSWLQEFRARYRVSPSIRVVLAVPVLYLERLAGLTSDLDQVELAVQSVSPYPPGGYTGETPAAWLRGLAGYALAGHRERRHYFHEDVQSIAGQVRETIAAGLQPILCLDQVIKAEQLAALETVDLEQVFLAYTPADAVRLEVARSAEDIVAAAGSLASSCGDCPVLYGGGVNRDNAARLINLQGISGILVGRSSLDGAAFAALVNAVE